MATAKATAKPRRLLKENGRVYREMAGDFPTFMVLTDGTLTALTHQERAFLRIMRTLPKNAKAEVKASMVRTLQAAQA